MPIQLREQCEYFLSTFEEIPASRQRIIQAFVDYLHQKISAQQNIHIIVICTHNSRRSHIAQLWLQQAAAWFGIENLHTYSGGTMATAFNPRAVAALQRVGFSIQAYSESSNPFYEVIIPGYANSPMKCFSKKYDHPLNPQAHFAALMVCSEADADCPFIPGAEARFAHPFEDPKAFDDGPMEQQMYDQRVVEIGRECFFILSALSKKIDQ